MSVNRISQGDVDSSPHQFDVLPGSPFPLGTVQTENGVNFVVFSPDAERVELCLFDDGENEIEKIDLPSRRGGYWFGEVEGVKPGQYYGYRVYGPEYPLPGMMFDPKKLLIDPYARSINRPLIWNAEQYEGDSAEMIPKSIVTEDTFDWQGVVKPDLDKRHTILYETHVKGFTQLHPDIPAEHRGTYLGLAHPSAIRHLKELGITAVQLMPVTSFMSEPRLTELGLSNYWGYNPVNYFAPDPRYGYKDPVNEFKTMVRELHRNEIEVILDVVYNHTAESGHGGPTLSFRGLDNRNYYVFEQGGSDSSHAYYSNHTGCGNTFNLDYPWGLRIVLDAMRYWVDEMQVDGFRFDLAVTLAREKGEFFGDSAFFKAVLQDPILTQTKLVAEPWDIGPGGYRLGQFPSQWNECNDRYRDTVRAFWRGDGGQLAEFATRLLGSKDIFPKTKRSISTSVNFIAYHDGFTLEDMVCYQHKHNQANCEENRDGHGHNLSDNYGEEGPTRDKAILQLRQQQKRNLLATLFLSQGMPHLLAGDEMGRTQLGNNNAYCQDNSISWVNWQLRDVDSELLRFSRQLIRLRQSSHLLGNVLLTDDNYHNHAQVHQSYWYHPRGRMMTERDWQDSEGRAIALELSDISDERPERMLILINAGTDRQQFRLPKLKRGHHWQRLFDTSRNEGMMQANDLVTNLLKVNPRSFVLLERI